MKTELTILYNQNPAGFAQYATELLNKPMPVSEAHREAVLGAVARGKATYICLNCKDRFTARTADRKRGWARYCSKSCKAKHQERRTGQHAAYLKRGGYL